MYVTGSIADKIHIASKRSTYIYNLPNTVNKSTTQAAVIQQQYLAHQGQYQQSQDIGKVEVSQCANSFCLQYLFTIVPVLKDHSNERPPVLKDLVFKTLS